MKTLALAALAISLCRPVTPAKTAEAYARVVVPRSDRIGIDRLIGIAIVKHESGWIPWAVSKDGEDYGLGQLRARYLGACAKDKSPLWAPGPACVAEKKRLLDGEYNLHAMYDAIERWIEVCRAKTGSATESQWLFAYAGLNRPKSNVWCGKTLSPSGSGKWVDLPVPSVVRQFQAGRRALRLRIEAMNP